MKKTLILVPTVVTTILTLTLAYVIIKEEKKNKRNDEPPFDFSLEDHIHLNEDLLNK